MSSAWVHTHLPRLRSGDTSDVLSVKVPGRRVEYVSWIALRDAEFRVHEKGRQRCLATGVRNVHAWVVGQEVNRVEGRRVDHSGPPAGWGTALYDPFRGGTFVDSKTFEPVLGSPWVVLSGKYVFYAKEG